MVWSGSNRDAGLSCAEGTMWAGVVDREIELDEQRKTDVGENRAEV